jgi:ABC-2 type transport system permease protein
MIHKEIYAIWLREVKKFLTDKWHLLFSIAWPIFLIFVIGVGIDSFVDVESLGMSYKNFLGPGVIALFSMSGAMTIGNSIIEDKKGYIKELLVSPISRFSIFVGKVLGEMTLNFALTLIVVVFFLIWIESLTFVAVAWAFLFMVLIAFGFYGLGLVLSFLFNKAKSYNLIAGVLITIIIFFSGAFFPIKGLPAWMKAISYINPLTYGVDGLREVMAGSSKFGLMTNLIFLVIFSIVMIFLGSYSFKKAIYK